ATGAVDTVAQANVNARRGSLDVGPNGNVAYDHVFGSSGGGGTTAGYMWTPSFSDLFYNAFTYGTLHLKTDGNNVIFTTMDTQGAIHLRLANPGSSYILSSAPGGSFAGPQPEGRVAGGWVAYLYRETNMGQWVAEVRLRSPTFSGAPPLYSERVSPAGGLAGLDALSPDGTVAWRIGQVVSGSAAYTRRYISPRNAPAVDAGPVESNERVIWRSGTFYLLKADGSVYAFSW
ncbi:MAG TPA: hypothetical protein VNP72_08370, partial [Longimicrobium sp.]|nr:hypothetical protein [Longimicrobium sp.]